MSPSCCRFLSSSAGALLLLSLLPSTFVAANDACADAIPINVATLPFFAAADLTGMTADFTTPTDNLRNLTCGISTQGAGIWYHVQGGPAFLEATVADAPGTSTKFNVALFESAGTSCEDMECRLPREYDLQNQRTEPKLTWFAQEGMSYYLLVAGTDATQVGPFNLDVKEVTMDAVPENDSCDAAQDLTVGASFTTTVNTNGARPHGLDNEACSLHAYSRGNFYSVSTTSSAQGMRVTMEPSALHEDVRMEIAVLEEGCETCVAVSDFLTVDDMPHSMEFAVTPGKSYVVVISGERFSDVGQVQIKVEELETVANGKLEGSAPSDTDAFGTAFGASGAIASFTTAFSTVAMMMMMLAGFV